VLSAGGHEEPEAGEEGLLDHGRLVVEAATAGARRQAGNGSRGGRHPRCYVVLTSWSISLLATSCLKRTRVLAVFQPFEVCTG